MDTNICRDDGCAARMDLTPTPEQVETGLCDGSADVRLAWSARRDYTPSTDQIRRGMSDSHESVRVKFAERLDWSPSAEDVDIGVNDPDYVVRLTWARRTDFVPTREQVDRGLNDGRLEIQLAWIKRRDFVPTLEQVRNALNSQSVIVRLAMSERDDYVMDDFVDDMIRSESVDVRVVWARKLRSRAITPEWRSHGLADWSSAVKLEWLSHPHLDPSRDEVDSGLSDVNEVVRLAWRERYSRMVESKMDGDYEPPHL